MTHYNAMPGQLVVTPDLPVESMTASGLHLPARLKADHYAREEDNYAKSYLRGEFQVVSGTVVEVPGRTDFAINMPTMLALHLGLGGRMYEPGMSECLLPMGIPSVGDKVWWGWKVWGGMETNGKVGMVGDGMLGLLAMESVHLVCHNGEYRGIGPYILCEPIPQVQEGSLVAGKLSHVPNAGIARYIGDFNPGNIKVGDVLAFKGTNRLGAPVPFQAREWVRVDVQNVFCVNPPWVQLPDDLKAAWEALEAHNMELAGHSKNLYEKVDSYNNEIDFLSEHEKKRKAMFTKLYRSRWF